MNPEHRLDDVTKAKLLLVALSFAWGLNWPSIRIGLEELTPWTFRLIGFTVSSLSLIAIVKLQGRSLAVPRGIAWLHIAVSSTLNVVAFGLFGTFAQLATATSRVVIVAYSFPVWASLLAWLILGEKLRTASTIGLVLCVAGLGILVYPVLSSPSASIGLLLALGSALVWAAGTIYLKIFRIPGELIVVTTWQVIFAAFALAICVLVFQGVPTFAPLAPATMMSILYNGLIGTGLAYLMWYKIIAHLPTATASLGVLAVPVVGVAASAIMLGERPTLPDIIGFALIFAAAACVILQPRDRKAAATP